MAESVEFWFMLLMFCLELFPSLICFDVNSNWGWKGVARSYIAFALGLFDLNCFHGGMVGGGVP